MGLKVVEQAPTTKLVEIRQVSMVFGAGAARQVVFENILFDVAPGSFVCIVGSSGCGKTTLLRQLAGLQMPTSGTIIFDGMKVARPSRDKAIVFQDYSKALLPWRTVEGNIALSLETTEASPEEIRADIDELLSKTGLTPAAQKYPSQLSGGMQQRVKLRAPSHCVRNHSHGRAVRRTRCDHAAVAPG